MKTRQSFVRALALGISAIAWCAVAQASQLVVNGSFETVNGSFTSSNALQTQTTNLPGWHTTNANGLAELWRAPGNDVGTPRTAASGTIWAELNARDPSNLYQEFTGVGTNAALTLDFAHRGRNGIDAMSATLTDLGADNLFGTADDSVLFSQVYGDDASSWAFYNIGGITSRGNTLRLAFAAVSSFGGAGAAGNFLDAVSLQAVPEPGSVALVGLGLFAALCVQKRKPQAETLAMNLAVA